MAETKGYLPVASSEEGNIGLPSQNPPESHLRRAIRSGVIVLSMLCMLLIGYLLGFRAGNASKSATIGRLIR